MATNYSVGDFLIRLQNASMAKRKEVVLESNKLIKATADALKRAKMLDEVTVDGKNIKVTLAYKKKEPILERVMLVSKPGLRIYQGAAEIAEVKRPTFFLVSTPKGILTSKEAIKENVGGEVIAEIL
jgi:small subunit ribosomal protein S8